MKLSDVKEQNNPQKPHIFPSSALFPMELCIWFSWLQELLLSIKLGITYKLGTFEGADLKQNLRWISPILYAWGKLHFQVCLQQIAQNFHSMAVEVVALEDAPRLPASLQI